MRSKSVKPPLSLGQCSVMTMSLFLIRCITFNLLYGYPECSLVFALICFHTYNNLGGYHVRIQKSSRICLRLKPSEDTLMMSLFPWLFHLSYGAGNESPGNGCGRGRWHLFCIFHFSLVSLVHFGNVRWYDHLDYCVLVWNDAMLCECRTSINSLLSIFLFCWLQW